MTDRAGRYFFDVQSGVRPDDCIVRVVKDVTGAVVSQVAQLSASITRGDQFIRGLDLPVTVSQPAPAVATASAHAAAAPSTVSAPWRLPVELIKSWKRSGSLAVDGFRVNSISASGH